MMTTVITPSQQGCRSRSQRVTLFILAKNLLCLLVAILLVTSPAAARQGKEHQQLDEADMDFITIINSCTELPNERTTVKGFVDFTAEIVCTEPRVRVCVWYGFLGSVVLRSCVALPVCYSARL